MVKCQHFMFAFYLWQGNINDFSSRDICTYCDINFLDMTLALSVNI